MVAGSIMSTAKTDQDSVANYLVANYQDSVAISNLLFLKNSGKPNNLAFSQPEEEEAGINIPFRFKNYRNDAVPSPEFVDLDADGNIDVVVGFQSSLLFFKNIGNKTEPMFEQLTDNLNPFFGIYQTYLDCSNSQIHICHRVKPALTDLGK